MVTAFSTHLHDDELARSHNDPKKACLFLAQFWMDEQVVTLSSKFTWVLPELVTDLPLLF